MPNTRDWSDAYLAQAIEDLEAARRLGGGAPSVLAMLLLMVFEKLAKAALLRSSQMTVRMATSSHRAASRMVAQLKRNRSKLKALGAGDAYAWKDVLPVVTELERAHPQLAEGGPQLEYPWEDEGEERVCWPAKDLPIARRLGMANDLTGARLLKLAGEIARTFDRVFP